MKPTYKIVKRIVVEYEYVIEADSKAEAIALARDLGEYGADEVVIASETVKVVGIVAPKGSK
jgi:hypothetical protein